MKSLFSKKTIVSLIVVSASLFNSSYLYASESDNDDVVKVPAKSSDAIGNMLLQSVGLMGIAYKWGGNTPDTGMDCSGFVRYVFQQSLGITLPRTAAQMAKVGKRISISDLEPGDLIFFNTRRGSNTHIGIYLGNNKFIQSPRTGENIQITELTGYWLAHFNGAKRVVQEDQDHDGQTVIEDYSEIHDEALPSVHYQSSKRQRIRVKTKHGRRYIYVSRHEHVNRDSHHHVISSGKNRKYITRHYERTSSRHTLHSIHHNQSINKTGQKAKSKTIHNNSHPIQKTKKVVRKKYH